MSTLLLWSWLAVVAAPPSSVSIPAGPSAEPADTVLVCPPVFLNEMKPWLAHRTQQGHVVHIVRGDQSATAIRDEIRAASRAAQNGDGLRAILLIGDADPAAERDPQVRARCTPTHQAIAKVNVKWGSEPTIAADNWYADLDDDDLPDAAIGRLPVDSPAELRSIVRRILAYEKSTDFGLWRRKVNFVAGVGGFGLITDAVLETATKKFLTDGIPTAYSTTMTYGSWRSPYCPDPRRFQQATVARFNEGCLFFVYIGHGHPLQLDRVQLPNAAYPILSIRDVGLLQSQQQPPIAVMLACYTGAFDLTRDCLAEEMLRQEGGPIALLCGSRITMPYAMAVMSHGMLEEAFKQRRETLGEVLLHAKRRMMKDEPEDGHRQLVDALAAALSPSPDLLVEERREHLHLFNLLGDPLLRLRHPAPIELEIATDVEAGQLVEVTAVCPIKGEATLELVCRRDRTKSPPPTRGPFEQASKNFEEFDATYQEANDHRWYVEKLSFDEPGAAKTEIRVPLDAHGPCHLKLHVRGADGDALGAANVFVRRLRNLPDNAAAP
ncbi:MAG: C25 family cysteine peptidase [Pirellulales bacterium]